MMTSYGCEEVPSLRLSFFLSNPKVSESPSNGKSQPRLRSIYHSCHNTSVHMKFRRTLSRALCAAIELALMAFATVTFDQVFISVFHGIGNVKLWCNCMYTWFECLIVCLYSHGCIPINTCTQLPSPKHAPFVQVHILLECTTVYMGLCLFMQSSSHSV